MILSFFFSLYYTELLYRSNNKQKNNWEKINFVEWIFVTESTSTIFVEFHLVIQGQTCKSF